MSEMTSSSPRFLRLCDKVCTGMADEQEIALLELALADAACRRAFLSYAAMHADLASYAGAERARERSLEALRLDPAPRAAGAKASIRRRSLRGRVAAALALAASIMIATFVARRSGPPPAIVADPTAPNVDIVAERAAIDGSAVLLAAEQVRWSAGAKQFQQGALLLSGDWIDIQSGAVHIEFGHGAVVVLEGPARFAAKSTARGQLDYGKLAAVVPPWADGFRVDTPELEVIDRGTQFVVEVAGDRRTSVGVTKGAVDVTRQSETASEVAGVGRSLKAGDAIRAIGSEIQAVSFKPRWRRLSDRLPARPSHNEVEVVAHYRTDFVAGDSSQPRRDGRWRYFANQWSAVDEIAGYKELLWDSQRQMYDGNGDDGLADSAPLRAANLSYRGGHPGDGADTSRDEIDHHVIAAYQVGEAGRYRIESGWLVRAESRDDLQNQAIDLRIRVNRRPDVLQQTCNRDGLLKFQAELGDLEAGDWIYIAVGPHGLEHNDRFEWDFAIVRDVPVADDVL